MSIDWPVVSETSVEERALRIAPGASFAVFGLDEFYPADEFNLTWAGSSELPKATPPIGSIVRVHIRKDRAPLPVSSKPIAIPLID